MKYERNEKANVLHSADNVEFMLSANEYILWQGKPNKRAYIINKFLEMLPIALLWLAFDSVFIVTAFTFNIPPIARIGILVFMCFHLIPFWKWLSNVLTASKRHQNTQYALTNNRILIRTGLIGVEFQSISYMDIQNVTLKKGFIDRMLKVGDIYFISTVIKGQNVFFDIEEPEKVYKAVQRLVTDIQTDIQYPNAYRPDNNPGYNTRIEP